MTVADVIAALSRLPGHLPVATSVVVGDGADSERITREASDVRWEGRYVALECDGTYL